MPWVTASRAAATSPSRDEADPRSRLADLLHGVLVAGAVEHDHGDVAHLDPPALGDPPDHVGERVGQAEAVGDLGAAGDLLHVDAGAGVEHRPALRQRDHRERRRLALGGEPGALERVDGDVDLGRAAVADPLAVVEHRRLVLLALADHDDAVHRHRVEHQPHRVDGGLVGRLLLAPPHPAGGGKRRGLGDPDQLEREVAVGPRARAHVVRDDAWSLALHGARPTCSDGAGGLALPLLADLRAEEARGRDRDRAQQREPVAVVEADPEGVALLFVDVVFPAPRLVIFGAIDFAAQLCTLARVSGWVPYVFDPAGSSRARSASPMPRRSSSAGPTRRSRRSAGSTARCRSRC